MSEPAEKSLCLTADELRDLTGYKLPKKQIDWLRMEGFIFRIAADGRPRVDRSHYLKLMGGVLDKQAGRKRTEPDFSQWK